MASRRSRRTRRATDGVAAGIAGAAGVVLVASAAGLLVATTSAAPPVAVAAATAPAPAAAPWTRAAPLVPLPGTEPTVPAPVVDSAGTPSSGPGMAVPQPPRPTRTGLVITPFVAVGHSPELTPRPAACGGHVTPRQVAPGVVPGPGGTATVTWRAGGQAEVVGYRVSAVSQTLRPGGQAAPVERTAAQPADCAPVALTFTGLTPGDAYVFWLEERTVDAMSVERLAQIGTSQPVVIEP